MSFLLDTDICSAYLKNEPRVVNHVMLHFGGLSVSTIVVGELFTWASRKSSPIARLSSVRDFLAGCDVLEITEQIAERFGLLRAGLLDFGHIVGEPDLFIAATALVHNHTLVTHNTADYMHVPGLTTVDWLE